jgi:hypothetical protein
MTNLNKRQMIILGVMILIVFYGVYTLMPSKAKQSFEDTGKKLAELKTFISTINATLAKEQTGADDRVIGLAEAGWSANPFYDKKAYKDWATSKGLEKTEEASQKLNIRYTGYVEGGKARLAIINGTEYMTGDTIGLEGYVLREILPTKVIIQGRTDKKKIEVPVQE